MVVYTGYGDGSLKPALFDELKAAGITIIYRDINPTPENSRRAEQAGADIIVATGFDEGGTLPGTALGTFTIVPLIVDAVQRVPVMAAGGSPTPGARAPFMPWAARACSPVRYLSAPSKAGFPTR